MKHFTTANVSSFVLFSVHTSLTVGATSELLDAMDLDASINLRASLTAADLVLLEAVESQSGARYETLLDFAHRFIFAHDRYTNPWSVALSGMLYPRQFSVLVDARKWFRIIWKQCQNRSPKYWSRTGDFVYVNLNRGKSVVFIDAHHWVE